MNKEREMEYTSKLMMGEKREMLKRREEQDKTGTHNGGSETERLGKCEDINKKNQTIKNSWNDETETHAMHVRSLEYKTYCVIETQCDDDTKLR